MTITWATKRPSVSRTEGLRGATLVGAKQSKTQFSIATPTLRCNGLTRGCLLAAEPHLSNPTPRRLSASLTSVGGFHPVTPILWRRLGGTDRQGLLLRFSVFYVCYYSNLSGAVNPQGLICAGSQLPSSTQCAVPTRWATVRSSLRPGAGAGARQDNRPTPG